MARQGRVASSFEGACATSNCFSGVRAANVARDVGLLYAMCTAPTIVGRPSLFRLRGVFGEPMSLEVVVSAQDLRTFCTRI